MYRRIAVFCLSIAVTACSSYNIRTLDFRHALLMGQPESALQQLELSREDRRDRVLYGLNKGMLLHATGDYAGSNEFLELAKQRMQELSATSVTENLTAIAVNEATRSYAGQPYEQLLVYAYKALNYLLLQQPDSARVEILQADVKMREWLAAGETEGLRASAFMQYLSGLIFENLREWDDALIAYRKAYEVYVKTGQTVPVQLQKDLLRLTRFRGQTSEHRIYRELFDLSDWETMAVHRAKGELVILIHQGLVSPIQEHIVFNYSPDLKYQIQIALPFYPLRNGDISPINVHINGRVMAAEMLEDIDALARADLDSRLAGITLRAMARMVVKKKIAHEARKDSPFAGFIADVAGLATERADTRSWISLPESVQMVRLTLAAGEYAIDVSGNDGVRRLPTLSLKTGQTTIVSVHDMAGRTVYAAH